MDVVKKVSDLVVKPIEKLGYKVETITYEKEDENFFLRVIIDKIVGISVDDCVNVSRCINPLLDEADLIEENYILDVCSK